MMKAQVWVLSKAVSGLPSLDDFSCIEQDLPQCKDGEILIEAEVFSVDPYIRYKLQTTPVNTCITGSQVAKVIESKSKSFPVGARIVCYPGWRSHTLYTKEDLESALSEGKMWPLTVGDNPKSLGLGVLGMPGNTAYFGFLEICHPKAGDIVVVNAAAGAVGTSVCQIAKIKGCTVIAFAGSENKVAWLKELGCDHVFNYKTTNISEVLKSCAPNGVNCYFDNVGGDFTVQVLPHMAQFGRVSLCGAISIYNEAESTPHRNGAYHEGNILRNQLKVEGFLVTRWCNRWMEGIKQMMKWVDEGKIKYKESKTEGFQNIPKAFIGLFHGENIGKAIVSA